MLSEEFRLVSGLGQKTHIKHTDILYRSRDCNFKCQLTQPESAGKVCHTIMKSAEMRTLRTGGLNVIRYGGKKINNSKCPVNLSVHLKAENNSLLLDFILFFNTFSLKLNHRRLSRTPKPVRLNSYYHESFNAIKHEFYNAI